MLNKIIGILGTGMVGKELSQSLSKLGYNIILGTRDPEREELVSWAAENAPRVSLQTFKDCASNSEFLIVAVNYENLDGFFELVEGADFRGKTIVDLMNPLNLSSGAPELGVGFNDSLGEIVQRKLHDAHVVKALNSITCSKMVNPQFEEGTADMLIAGNDSSAKREVTEFLSELGWRVID